MDLSTATEPVGVLDLCSSATDSSVILDAGKKAKLPSFVAQQHQGKIASEAISSVLQRHATQSLTHTRNNHTWLQEGLSPKHPVYTPALVCNLSRTAHAYRLP